MIERTQIELRNTLFTIFVHKMNVLYIIKISKIIIAILILGFSIPFSSFSQDKDNNKVNLSEAGKDCLKFTCKVLIQNEPISPIEVILFLNNNTIDHRILDKSKKLNFILKRDAYYIIQISAPFYIARYVIIDTRIPEKIEQGRALYKHEMEIEIFKEPKIYDTPKLNSDILNEPITIIRFKSQEDKFDIDLKYTSKIKRELRKFKKNMEKLVIDQSKEIQK